MKYLITERQFRLLNEEDTEEPVVPKKIKVIHYEFFDKNWDKLQNYLNRNETRKNTPYILHGDLDFGRRDDIKTLGSLVGVDGDLDLNYCRNITDLGELQFVKGDFRLQGCTKIKNLGNLESVGGNLDIPYTKITSLRNVKSVGGNLDIGSSDIESLGKLEYVGKNIYWGGSDLSKRATKDEIFNIPNLTIKGGIYY